MCKFCKPHKSKFNIDLSYQMIPNNAIVKGRSIDFSAPGVDILSSYHVHSDHQNDNVETISGTSLATPIAVSSLALILSANPGLTPELVGRSCLIMRIV